mmetsp:Transcript_61731/g.180385  ORF Transcript_61731/g.180385 Transcript_61731/m.180385 type:complete len:82 (-) Transcript_61731:194-439(-)
MKNSVAPSRLQKREKKNATVELATNNPEFSNDSSSSSSAGDGVEAPDSDLEEANSQFSSSRSSDSSSRVQVASFSMHIDEG